MKIKNISRKIICISMCFALLSCCIACQEGKNTEVNFISTLPEYKRTKALEIDAWLGPKTTDEALKDYADGGYTTYHLQSENFSTTNTQMSNGEMNDWLDRVFTKSKQYGLKVVLAPTAVNTSATSIVPFEYTYSRVGKTLDKWKEDSTFYGFMSTDETTLDKSLVSNLQGLKFMQSSYERSVDFLLDDYLFFSSKYPGKYFETVLLGIPNGSDVNMPYFTESKHSFEEYMECYYNDFIKYIPMRDRLYSFDAYPFSARNNVYLYQDRFVGSLEGISVYAEKAGAVKGTYIQNHHSIFNGEAVDFQYFTAMTYGYTHFTTYCYTNGWGEKQFSTTNAGVKTDNYYYFKRAHEKVRAMEDVYTNFCDRRIGTMGVIGKNEGIITWSKCKKMNDSLPYIHSVEAEHNLLIGAFLDKDNVNGYMIANQMMPDTLRTNTIKIQFNGANKLAVWADGKEMTIIEPNSNGDFLITLASGGGAFVIPMSRG